VRTLGLATWEVRSNVTDATWSSTRARQRVYQR
jgi:hypothetical protein